MLIRSKLTLRFTLLVLAIQVCFSLYVYSFYAANRELRFQNRLAGKAELSGRLLLRSDDLRRGILSSFRRRDLLTLPKEQISIYGPSDWLLYTSDDSIDQRGNLQHLNRPLPGKPVAFKYGGLEVLGIVYEHAGQSYRIFAAGLDEGGLQQQRKLALTLVFGNLGALVLIIAAGWYFADEALKPMSRIVDEVKRITATRLSQRLHEGNRKDEIAQLAITFNLMLAELEQAFEAQKSFVSHASHELRTPLANALGTLQTAYAYDTSLHEAKRSMASAEEELRRIIELTNGLLALAKAEGTTSPSQAVRLDECVTLAIDQAQAKYASCPVHLEFGLLPADVEDPFQVRGNEHLLTTALTNVIDNACKYSDGTVTVQLGYHDRRTLLVQVSDGGIGIQPAEQERIFEPLYRAENGRSRPGHGIGLAIVRKVVDLHGGELLVQSAVGEGTTVAMRLPAL